MSDSFKRGMKRRQDRQIMRIVQRLDTPTMIRVRDALRDFPEKSEEREDALRDALGMEPRAA